MHLLFVSWKAAAVVDLLLAHLECLCLSCWWLLLLTALSYLDLFARCQSRVSGLVRISTGCSPRFKSWMSFSSKTSDATES